MNAVHKLHTFTDSLFDDVQPKQLTAELRLHALIAAEMNGSRIAECPNMEPAIRKLLEMNAKLFAEIAR